MEFLITIVTNETVIALLLGGLASFLQGQKGKSLGPNIRLGMSVGACVIVAFFASYVENIDTGGLTPDQVLSNIAKAFTSSQILYKTYFKPKK